MSQPLAVLNDEEMHWQTTSVSLINGVGSIIVHSVTNTAERFPSAATDSSINRRKKAQKAHQRFLKKLLLYFVIFVPLWLEVFVANRV